MPLADASCDGFIQLFMKHEAGNGACRAGYKSVDLRMPGIPLACRHGDDLAASRLSR